MPSPHLLFLLRRLRAPLASLFAVATLALLPPLAHALSTKVATDLQKVVDAASTPNVNFARDINGVRYVKVLIVSSSADPELAALRQAVLGAGGSVYFRYTSVSALSALLPAAWLPGTAERVRSSVTRLMLVSSPATQ